MKLSTLLLTASCLSLALVSCGPRQVQSLDGFDCASGKPGWKRAQAVTPDVVGKCHTGSQGTCGDFKLEYAPGTGWCRPRR